MVSHNLNIENFQPVMASVSGHPFECGQIPAEENIFFGPSVAAARLGFGTNCMNKVKNIWGE